jgi:hypothetical protein
MTFRSSRDAARLDRFHVRLELLAGAAGVLFIVRQGEKRALKSFPPHFWRDAAHVSSPAWSTIFSRFSILCAQLSSLAASALAYRDLSDTADSVEVAQQLFDALRWAEAVVGAETVLLVDSDATHGQHSAAVHDRMFRAASGQRVALRVVGTDVQLRSAPTEEE